MDNAIEPSRRISDGFALVSTDGIAGIPALHENRVIGTTDDGGQGPSTQFPYAGAG